MLTVIDKSGYTMVVESVSPTNTEKVRARKRKTKMVTVWKTHQLGIKNVKFTWPVVNLRLGYKYNNR